MQSKHTRQERERVSSADKTEIAMGQKQGLPGPTSQKNLQGGCTASQVATWMLTIDITGETCVAPAPAFPNTPEWCKILERGHPQGLWLSFPPALQNGSLGSEITLNYRK